ncbi:hypothetical protein HNP29_000327 [Pseudomonas alcaligenes]|nr:hypothetical protein [Pseudomonas alcaligenes]
MINFNVHFAVEDMEGKTVLVFLKPQNPQRDYNVHAWRVLTGSAGATERFGYETQIEVDVTSVGNSADQSITSGRKAIQPGQLFQAVSPAGLSPMLQSAPSSLAQEKLTPLQCGVINRTDPFIQFDCNWYIGGHPAVTLPRVDVNMTVSFELMPDHFYFMVTTPPMEGQTYTVQSFSDMTLYVLPVTANQVDVTLTRPNGLWSFDFQARS